VGAVSGGVAATVTTLMNLPGIGPAGAARLLVEVSDITRFPDRNHFALLDRHRTVDPSSGDQVRHRLSRAGNRLINRVLHTMAVVQLRNPTDARVLRPQESSREDLDGGHALPPTQAL
jgi:transposase